MLAQDLFPKVTIRDMTTDVQIEKEDATEEPIEEDELDVGQAVGDLAEHIIGTLTSSTQDVIELFQEVVQSVGTVLEDVSLVCCKAVRVFFIVYFQHLPPSTWHFLCIATWYPLQEEHCAQARCAVCSPAIMSAVSVCRTASRIDHKCIQKVFGIGPYLNF